MLGRDSDLLQSLWEKFRKDQAIWDQDIHKEMGPFDRFFIAGKLVRHYKQRDVTGFKKTLELSDIGIKLFRKMLEMDIDFRNQ